MKTLALFADGVTHCEVMEEQKQFEERLRIALMAIGQAESDEERVRQVDAFDEISKEGLDKGFISLAVYEDLKGMTQLLAGSLSGDPDQARALGRHIGKDFSGIAELYEL